MKQNTSCFLFPLLKTAYILFISIKIYMFIFITCVSQCAAFSSSLYWNSNVFQLRISLEKLIVAHDFRQLESLAEKFFWKIHISMLVWHFVSFVYPLVKLFLLLFRQSCFKKLFPQFLVARMQFIPFFHCVIQIKMHFAVVNLIFPFSIYTFFPAGSKSYRLCVLCCFFHFLRSIKVCDTLIGFCIAVKFPCSLFTDNLELQISCDVLCTFKRCMPSFWSVHEYTAGNVTRFNFAGIMHIFRKSVFKAWNVIVIPLDAGCFHCFHHIVVKLLNAFAVNSCWSRIFNCLNDVLYFVRKNAFHSFFAAYSVQIFCIDFYSVRSKDGTEGIWIRIKAYADVFHKWKDAVKFRCFHYVIQRKRCIFCKLFKHFGRRTKYFFKKTAAFYSVKAVVKFIFPLSVSRFFPTCCKTDSCCF